MRRGDHQTVLCRPQTRTFVLQGLDSLATLALRLPFSEQTSVAVFARPGSNCDIGSIRDGCLVIKQNKRRGTAIVRVQIEGKLKLVIDRISARKYKITSTSLLRNERGAALTFSAFRGRFDDAREKADGRRTRFSSGI